MRNVTARGRRAAALTVIAVTSVVAAAGVYLRLSPTLPPPSIGPDRTLVSSTAIDYDFATPSVGWALLSVYGSVHGVGPPEPLHFTVFRTTDGAKHWRPQLAGVTQARLGQPHGLNFVDQTNGFLFLGGSPAQLYRTADAGVHWRLVGPLPATDVSQVGFTDPTHGWIVSGGLNPQLTFGPAPAQPQLFSTQDGGDTWRTLPQPPREVGLAAFKNATEAWMGTLAAGRPYVYVSNDGAISWQSRYLPPPPGVSWTTDPLQGLLLIPSTVRVLPGAAEVAAVTDAGEQYVFMTTDEGRTWTYVPPPPGTIAYLDSRHWWAYDGRRLFTSSDAGASWNTVSESAPTSLVTITPLDAMNAWATQVVVGGYGLVTTNDGGAHWNRRSVPVPGTGS